jgi:hypothetical protein
MLRNLIVRRNGPFTITAIEINEIRADTRQPAGTG